MVTDTNTAGRAFISVNTGKAIWPVTNAVMAISRVSGTANGNGIGQGPSRIGQREIAYSSELAESQESGILAVGEFDQPFLM